MKKTISYSLGLLLIFLIWLFIGFMLEGNLRKEAVENAENNILKNCIIEGGSQTLTISYWKCINKDNELVNVVAKCEGWVYQSKCTAKIIRE